MVVSFDHMKELVIHGIPDIFRSDMWLFMSGAMHSSGFNSRVYQKLLKENEGREDFA